VPWQLEGKNYRVSVGYSPIWAPPTAASIDLVRFLLEICGITALSMMAYILSKGCEEQKGTDNDKMVRQMYNEKIEKVKYFFEALSKKKLGICKVGMNVRFNIDESNCHLFIDLDNLEKDKIINLIAEGKLREEITILYNLAHLPYAECHSLNVGLPGIDLITNGKLHFDNFDIIDRVSIDLNKAFHPLSKDVAKKIIFIHPYLGDVPAIENGIAYFKVATQIKTHEDI
jgi:hypothetical protein